MKTWRFAISHCLSLPSNCRSQINGHPWLVTLLLVTASFGATGCGTNIDLLLLRSAEATGRTFLDIFLTDLANTLAQQIEDSTTSDNSGDTNNPPDSGSDDGAGSGGSLDGFIGDPAIGQAIFIDNGCGGCHCDDASGGCALEAPPIVGVLIDVLDAHVRGSADHPVKIDNTDQQLADLQAYLASL